MKKTTLTIAAIVGALVLAAVPFVYAAPQRMGGHGMDGEMGPLAHLQKLQSQLGLSDQQTAEIKAIFADLRDQNAQYRDQLRGGFEGVITTLLKNPNDVAGAQALIDQQTAAKRAVQVNSLNAASKALSVLTPEQREKLGQIIADHHSKMLQMHHSRF